MLNLQYTVPDHLQQMEQFAVTLHTYRLRAHTKQNCTFKAHVHVRTSQYMDDFTFLVYVGCVLPHESCKQMSIV